MRCARRHRPSGAAHEVVKEVRWGPGRFFGWLGSFAFFVMLCLLWRELD
ncbi:hypothetical protein LX15_000311 [Streptoalloteichus tenebrarius]|uniref:Uncharacterized protein n=1 Tax=Streptoalloteichus tenebrarius (strain ATCC 17920 / DSM 40477 / JCM 4838 / CBS 697.72 / NBRC 16177 / NCIMB 11028 / NRRL B-12390 / A12253. 1 / ISP 5477) TaxID=1933 RepID=A0ABT1HM86_STRSD|nr:hypothetical protein [Streptoalloteichus tenebrarius]MCP2256628.1 hypothetical protein [Streptoalloteichus tenebrarius]